VSLSTPTQRVQERRELFLHARQAGVDLQGRAQVAQRLDGPSERAQEEREVEERLRLVGVQPQHRAVPRLGRHIVPGELELARACQRRDEVARARLAAWALARQGLERHGRVGAARVPGRDADRGRGRRFAART